VSKLPRGNPPVLVVGAGPVGLTLACELLRRGIECRIIDSGEGPTPSEQSRALAVHARTLEVFDDIGIAQRLVKNGRQLRAINAYEAGRRIARFELDFHGVETSYPYLLVLSQGETERFLIDRVKELGGQVEWNTRLSALRQDAEEVVATLATSAGEDHQVCAAWLAGCDGAHSAVRHALDLAFEGAEYQETFLLADLSVDWQFDQSEAHLLLTSGGLLPAIPLLEPGRWRLIDATGAQELRDPQAIVARFEQLVRAAGLPKSSLADPTWAASFRIHRRTVERFRAGRCFLLGDAAHIHSPVGGQGMNIGVQDAYNLGWKLAMVLQSRASPELLDSYDLERRPVALAIRRGTDRATRVVTLRNPILRTARKYLAAWLSKRTFVRRRMTRQLSQLGIGYPRSPIVDRRQHRHLHGLGVRPGDRFPDATLRRPETCEPVRLLDRLRGVRHRVIIFFGRQPDGAAAASQCVEELLDERPQLGEDAFNLYGIMPEDSAPSIREWAGETLIDPGGRFHQLLGIQRSALYLVRPDGYVAYRGQPASSADLIRFWQRTYAPPG
jgi:2-polyprenyl-6-methoxyphenol hydroxylase-like FAD-dependent oxidoreductase